MKLFSMTAATACLALSLSVPTGLDKAYAHHKHGEKHDHTAATIAGVVALGVLGAALAHHQHKNNTPRYTPHPRFHPDENAVGTCMHKAQRLVRDAGGTYAELNRVEDVKYKNNGRTVVWMQVTGYYRFANKTSDVRCVVKNGRIVKFQF